MAFCNDCGANIVWHKTVEGKNVPLDPDPRPDGDFTFNAALRVVRAPADLQRAVREANAEGRVHAKKLYKVHFDTCTKARPRAPRESLACFRCGSTDHLVAECPEDE